MMEPARHQLAAATKAVDAAMQRSKVPEDIARAALVAASSAGDVVIPAAVTLACLSEKQWPEIGAVVYLTSYDDRAVVPGRVAKIDFEGERFKLEHPDAPGVPLRGFGRFEWFQVYDIYATAEHAYLSLAHQAADMLDAAKGSIEEEVRLRDRCLAAAQDAALASSADAEEVRLRV